MRLYNTLTRSMEELRPLAPPTVTMYVCGPTVYDHPHIGHARSAYVFDVLRRYLEFKKFQVRFVRNVTDVDDKIIEKARQVGGTDLKAACVEIAERYLASYHGVLERLGIGRPTEEPRATTHVVPEMTDFIAKLLLQGAAYEAKGDVYFAVRKFEGYGKLSNRTLDELQAGTRIEPGDGKHDPLDFALWKAAKPGEPSWNSPWGAGRPGWHIECSAMSTKYLGDTFDIHGGGVDLVFPHHENEVAQSHAAGKPFARYWMHNGLLTVKSEKMSKSLGNFITVDDALKACGENPDILKMFFLSGHYRSPLNYRPASVTAAQQRYEGYRHLIDVAENPQLKGEIEEFMAPIAKLEKLKQAFFSALDDDVNTPQALSALDGMRALGWELQDEKGTCLSVAKSLVEHGKLLGLFEKLEKTDRSKQIDEWFEHYVAARARKDFKTSDALRKQLHEEGFVVQDIGEQSRLIPKR